MGWYTFTLSFRRLIVTIPIQEQVQANKDLDLPTQQELLAQFRCDEISALALSEFNEQAKSQKKPVEAGKVVEDLGAMMNSWRTTALCMKLPLFSYFSCLKMFAARYDRDGSRYHKNVYSRKRSDLIATIDATLSSLFIGQLKNLHKACLMAFKKELQDGLRGEDYSFADVVSKARQRCESTFSKGAKEALVEDTDWTWEDELELLKDEIGLVADQCRKDETKKLLNLAERNVKKLLSEPVEVQLAKPSRTMWDEVLRAFKDVLSKTEATYLARAKSNLFLISLAKFVEDLMNRL